MEGSQRLVVPMKEEAKQRPTMSPFPASFDRGARELGRSTAATTGDLHLLCRRWALFAFGVLEEQGAGRGGRESEKERIVELQNLSQKV